MVGRCTRPPIFGVRTHATPSRLWQHNVMHRRPHYHAIQYVARIIAHPSVHFQPDTPNAWTHILNLARFVFAKARRDVFKGEDFRYVSLPCSARKKSLGNALQEVGYLASCEVQMAEQLLSTFCWCQPSNVPLWGR